MSYAIYLRKSRVDTEAEQKGEGETLVRHEKILLSLAKSQKLNIVSIYKEIVSGETISSRPVMQDLLSSVEQGVYKGVLVAEVERLARGDTIDQGIVSQAFKLSNTKIITPLKTYDPNNEFDEEYFEFGLFMSRREYKIINRRLQNGRLASVKEGKYVGNVAPYGYQRVKIKGDKGYTLISEPNESEIIKTIFDLYTNENRIGVALIVRKLNNMGIKPRHSDAWTNATIQGILHNPVYIGKIRWNARKQVKKVMNGEITKSRPRAKHEDITFIQGLHEPLISVDIWQKAQDIINKNRRSPTPNMPLTNPLAGIVRCSKCGRKMTRRLFNHNQQQYLLCPVTSCKNVSTQFDYVEDAIIEGLKSLLTGYNMKTENNSPNEKSLLESKIVSNYKKELEKLQAQLEKLHDLLEQGVYSVDVFLDRSKVLGDKKEALLIDLRKAENELQKSELSTEITDFIPKLENAIELYYSLDTPELKNRLLKSVIENITYTKDKGGRWHNNPKDFKINISVKH